MLPQQATSDRLPHLISVGRQRNRFRREEKEEFMAVKAEVQQLKKKSGEKITKIHLGGFCDWKKRQKRK